MNSSQTPFLLPNSHHGSPFRPLASPLARSRGFSDPSVRTPQGNRFVRSFAHLRELVHFNLLPSFSRFRPSPPSLPLLRSTDKIQHWVWNWCLRVLLITVERNRSLHPCESFERHQDPSRRSSGRGAVCVHEEGVCCFVSFRVVSPDPFADSEGSFLRGFEVLGMKGGRGSEGGREGEGRTNELDSRLELIRLSTVSTFVFYRPGSNALLATFYISSFPNLILAFIPPDLDLKNLNVMIAVRSAHFPPSLSPIELSRPLTTLSPAYYASDFAWTDFLMLLIRSVRHRRSSGRHLPQPDPSLLPRRASPFWGCQDRRG